MPSSSSDRSGEDESQETGGLSAYERQRQENIARNAAMLASLGLDTDGNSSMIARRGSLGGSKQPREKKDYGTRELPQRQRAVVQRLDMSHKGGPPSVAQGNKPPAASSSTAPAGATAAEPAAPPTAPFVPTCPECGHGAERLEHSHSKRHSIVDTQAIKSGRRFACLDPSCAHEVPPPPPQAYTHSRTCALARMRTTGAHARTNILERGACTRTHMHAHAHARACMRTRPRIYTRSHPRAMSTCACVAARAQWNVHFCGLCGQPKRGHTCTGLPWAAPAVPPPPQLPPPPTAPEHPPLSRLARACLMHDEVVAQMAEQRQPSTSLSEFVSAACVRSPGTPRHRSPLGDTLTTL